MEESQRCVQLAHLEWLARPASGLMRLGQAASLPRLNQPSQDLLAFVLDLCLCAEHHFHLTDNFSGPPALGH